MNAPRCGNCIGVERMVQFDKIIRGGQVWSAAGAISGEVGIRDGKIAALGEDLGDADVIVDASDLLVLPGGVDVHAHIEQMSGMGVMNADTFETATHSAALGGTTTVVSFAAQAAGQGIADTVADYGARARRGAMIDYAFHMIVRDTQVADFDEEVAALIHQGHRSIKVFTTYNIKLDDTAILQLMRAAKTAGALVCVHAENDAILAQAKDALLAQGLTRPEHHALSHPRLAEVEAISRMCYFAKALNQPVMIFHVSSAEGLDVVRRAQAEGAPVWAETCPHYLLMTDDVLQRDGLEGAKWMCSPPQRKAADQDALWGGLMDGTLSVVSSDHAPYRFDQTGKLSAGPNATFPEIANGLPGLEVRMPLMFDAIVSQGRGSVADFIRLTAQQPADLYGLTAKGDIAVGKDADLVLWDAGKRMTYRANDLHDNVGYNPWQGHSVQGWPETVLLRGQVIVADGTCLADAGQGQWLHREAIGTMPKAADPDLGFAV